MTSELKQKIAVCTTYRLSLVTIWTTVASYSTTVLGPSAIVPFLREECENARKPGGEKTGLIS